MLLAHFNVFRDSIMHGIVESDTRKIEIFRVFRAEQHGSEDKAARLDVAVGSVLLDGESFRLYLLRVFGEVVQVALQRFVGDARLVAHLLQQVLAQAGALRLADDFERLGDVAALVLRFGEVVLPPQNFQLEVDEGHGGVEAVLVPLVTLPFDDVVGVETLGQRHKISSPRMAPFCPAKSPS